MFFFTALVLYFETNAQTGENGLSREKLDSLYTKLLQVKAPELLPESERFVTLTAAERKCGFGLVNQVKINLENFTLEQQNILRKILDRPAKQTSMVSPSGFFRIHYDETGSEVPNYDPSLSTEENVTQVAAALDYSYNFEINTLGYQPPPPDNGVGGDDKYDIYITQALGGYGFTQAELSLGDEKYTSYIEIHYSFQGFPTDSLDAMKVTIAHEFHHAIQMGNYVFRDADIYFHEMTSTAMEEFVYDDVNDYYFYIKFYSLDPSRKFTRNNWFNGDGYDLAIWNIFLRDNFGYDIIKQQWEQMPNYRAINAINNTIINSGSTFPYELNKFGIWTYFTDYRSVQGLYFEEAENYPPVTPFATYSFTPPYQLVQVDAQSCSNNFLKFKNTANNDSLFAIVTNGDVSSASPIQSPLFLFDYTLFSDSASGLRKLTENYSSTFNVTTPTLWSVSEILNNIVVYQDSTPTPPAGSISYAYPNPFFYGRNYLTGSLIFFPVDSNVGERVDLNIYTSGMQLVYSNSEDVRLLPGNQKGVSWNALDYNGEKPASGVYIYVIKKGDDILKGKVVIFNE
jgi:hypothetical protein